MCCILLPHFLFGHLFQGRYKGILVERDSYLLELARYVVLNPLRAKMCKVLDDYLWSSYRPTMGLDPVPSGLSIDWLLGQFAKTRPVARQRYAAFVQAGIGQPSPWRELKGQVLLGSQAFIEKVTPQIKNNWGQSKLKIQLQSRCQVLSFAFPQTRLIYDLLLSI